MVQPSDGPCLCCPDSGRQDVFFTDREGGGGKQRCQSVASLGKQGWRTEIVRLQLTLGPGFTVLCDMNVFLSVISKSAFLSEKLLEVKTLELLAYVPL